jgi:hypothetical protein
VDEAISRPSLLPPSSPPSVFSAPRRLQPYSRTQDPFFLGALCFWCLCLRFSPSFPLRFCYGLPARGTYTPLLGSFFRVAISERAECRDLFVDAPFLAFKAFDSGLNNSLRKLCH